MKGSVTVIDSDNYKATGIETFFFPGGEPHARIPKDFGNALLFLKPRTWNDIGLAICVLDAVRRQGRASLFVPYFPAARQDRSDGQTPITANIMMELFDQVADQIYTFDAHSPVTSGLVDYNFMPSDMSFNFEKEFTVIAPDHGAVERARNFAEAKSSIKEVIQCDKQRDFATGKFTGFSMPALPGPGNYLIVDDICDGGGTFNLLAQEFEKDPAARSSNLWLWVSHGIFSKGVDAISKTISSIYTTDSFAHLPANPYHDPRLQVIPLYQIINKIITEDF
jgi:ribose-phosphate pyrophosphokinase